jgi:hypothetical protein
MASIRKRTFGKNKDQEVWIVDYYDQHKKRHIKTFPNKKAAEAWKVGAQHDTYGGVRLADGRASVATVAQGKRSQ